MDHVKPLSAKHDYGMFNSRVRPAQNQCWMNVSMLGLHVLISEDG